MLFIALNNLTLFGETGEGKNIYIPNLLYLPKYYTILRTLNSFLWIWIPVWLHFLSAWRASFSFSWMVYLTECILLAFLKLWNVCILTFIFWRIVLLDIEVFFDFFFSLALRICHSSERVILFFVCDEVFFYCCW